ncbi:hypothetical protein [Kordia sp.]|uniref:hypothetical protein n=1 Tax=Kordia sp. TaxID=1965332 RepID=UPI003B5AFF67
MFRICIFLFVYFIHFSVIAQKSTEEFRTLEPDPHRLLNKFKQIKTLRSEKFIYIAKRKDNNFKSDTIHVETYDKRGNKIQRTSYEYNTINYNVKNTFNKKGNKIHSTTHYRKRPTRPNAVKYTYDSDDNLILSEGFRLKEKDTLSRSYSKFAYKNKHLVSKENYNQDRFVIAQHFQYDDKGNMTYMHTGIKPEIGTYIEYIYNNKSQITDKLEYVKYINSDEKFYLYKSKFMYNDKGKMIKDSVYSESKKHWTVSDYSYNKEGFLSKINVKRNEHYRNVDYTYTNNKLQKMTVVTNYNSVMKIRLHSTIYSAKMPATYEEFYTYDEKGRIKSTKIYVNNELQAEYNRHIFKL